MERGGGGGREVNKDFTSTYEQAAKCIGKFGLAGGIGLIDRLIRIKNKKVFSIGLRRPLDRLPPLSLPFSL